MKPPKLPELKKNKKALFQLIGIGLALIFAWSLVTRHVSCVGGMPVLKKKAGPEQREIEQPTPSVKVYKVAPVNFRDSLPALGTIKGFREYDLKFTVQGTVEYINFREGEKITQGDIIASLDQKDALLKLEYSKIEYDKNKKLLELGSIAESKLKQSQIEYQSVKSELDKTNLIAFSDGYIGSLNTEKGANVTPQDKIATFVDFADVYAEFGVIEKDIPKVKEGQNVEVSLDAFPEDLFKGQVDSVSPIVEGRSRTMKVRAKLANPDEKLRPGMFGRVSVLIYEKEDAIVIPSSSLKKKEDQYFVYIVHPDEQEAPAQPSPEEGQMPSPAPVQASGGTIEVRTVDVAYATPDSIEIKEGVDEGELVVVDVEQDLQDKMNVEISETQEGIF